MIVSNEKENKAKDSVIKTLQTEMNQMVNENINLETHVTKQKERITKYKIDIAHMKDDKKHTLNEFHTLKLSTNEEIQKLNEIITKLSR